jgi:hypothetical protein
MTRESLDNCHCARDARRIRLVNRNSSAIRYSEHIRYDGNDWRECRDADESEPVSPRDTGSTATGQVRIEQQLSERDLVQFLVG